MFEQWAVWDGVEVEGRLAGVRTLFLWAMPDGFDPAIVRDYPHVYFCPAWLDQHGNALIDDALQHAVVTVELRPDQLPVLTLSQRHRCHLMLTLDIPEDVFYALKPTDTVKLEGGPFRTRSFIVKTGLTSNPTHYQSDRLIAAVQEGGQVRD